MKIGRFSGCIIWMSAGNSYFREQVIYRTLVFASERFHDIIILSPDKSAEHTFLALGYEKSIARKKAHLNANLLINRAGRAVAQLKTQKPETNFILPDWDGIEATDAYKSCHDKIKELYNEDNEFRKDARSATESVLAAKTKTKLNLQSAVDIGVQYLLEELAFVMAAPELYGLKSVTYLYHKKWEIYEKLISGRYSLKVKNLFFMLAE
jgi:tRNA-dependent cyclodipeptide synthase